MTIAEMIETLQEMQEMWGDETEVRIAVQPNYPFEHSVAEIVEVDGCPVCGECESCHMGDTCEDSEDGMDSDDPTIVYIGVGQQLGYLPGTARRALQW